MSYMNPFNVNNEIKNLNNIINNLTSQNSNIQHSVDTLNETINNVQINKPDNVDIINIIDEIKDEIVNLNNKVYKIIKKQFLTNIDIPQECEAYKFLTSINIDKNFINIILFLDYKTIDQLIAINIDDLKEYGISEDILDEIINKAKKELSTFV
jgi:mevalonate kinase